MTRPLAVLVIGRGRLGRGLGRAMRSSGMEVTTWAGRGRWPREAPSVAAIILAVPDHVVREVAMRVAPRVAGKERVALLHLSGALGPEVLAGVGAAAVGVMHPLASVAGIPSPSLAKTTFVLAGDRAAVAVARRIVRALGARGIARALHGPAYHAAAALVANGAAALAARAVEILTGLGMNQREAERAIGGLLGTVADNVTALGVPEALTGPIVRGDAATVARHRVALASVPAALRAYDAVAPLVLDTARAAGLSAQSAEQIERALEARVDERAQPQTKKASTAAITSATATTPRAITRV